MHTPVHAEKIDASKKTLSEVKKKIESLKKALGSSEEAHKDAADALKESETAISKSNRKLYQISKLQKENNKKLSKLNTSVEKTTEKLKRQQALLNQQLYKQYTQGQQNHLQLLLQQEKPNEIARDLQYLSYISKARAKAIHEMQASLDRLAKLNLETKQALQKVSALKQAQIDQQQKLKLQKKKKAKVVSSLSNKIASQRNQIKKLKRNEKSLSNLVKKLAKAAAKQKAKRLAEKSKQKSSKKTGKKDQSSVVAKNNIEPSNEFSGVKFSSLKGKLRLPVKGSVTNRFGKGRKDTGISWKGLFIKAKEGANVKSVANGRVIFSDWMRGFGNLIIVDHGGGYMSLYGNNQAILKSVDDQVKAGDVIATVGNTGGNKTNGLYYELRKKSKPFDPMRWSKIK